MNMVGLGILCVFIDLLSTAWNVLYAIYFKKDSEVIKRPAWVFLIGEICVVVILIAIFCTTELGASNDLELATNIAFDMVVVGLIAVSVVNALIFFNRKNLLQKITYCKPVVISNDKKIAFYNECFSNGIQKCELEKEIQKATLIANKQGIITTDIVALFNESKYLEGQAQRVQEQSEINNIKNKERDELEILTKYASYNGRDKRIAMLTDSISKLRKEAESARNASIALPHLLDEKEHDSAILGGVAAGIAGTAFGVATAMSYEQENAAIRARNAERSNKFAKASKGLYERALSLESEIRNLERDLDSAETSLVSDMDMQKCFKYLIFSNTSIHVSKTGTCIVETEATLTEPLYIFEDVLATIDGSIEAKILMQGAYIGSATMVLPKDGVSKGQTANLRGICLFCGKPEVKYQVAFAPRNLWAMEQ